MRVHLVLIALIGLLLLAGAGNAAWIPDQSSTITSSANWTVVAHQSTITVVAYNTTGGPISGATVTMNLDSTTLGSLSPSSGTTDGSGQVNGTFTAGTTPGAVKITATITYNDAGNITTITKNCTQYIDHDIPYTALFNYKPQVTVNTEIPFNISFTDRYGNPIDNRNPFDPHHITLHISSTATNSAAFDISGTYVHDATLQLNPQGNISVNVLTDISGGENIIELKPFGNIGDTIKSIIGITDGVPFSISSTVIPEGASLPADNLPTHKFTFIYSLFDQFGNIAENQSILVHSSWPADSDVNLTTNEYGQVSFNYGPHSASGNVTFTATALSNSSVSAVSQIQYYNTAPVSMVLTATPQLMPSLDAKAGETSQLIAKVTDMMGNPVANQTVTFSMGTPSYDYDPCVIGNPVLLNTSAETDYNGNAIVTFVPGSFDTNKTNVTFDATATGNVIVTASWTTVQQQIQLTWKNYPYLSIQETVNPSQVNVGDTMDVTIALKGDGWNLTGKPADIVIVTDLAGGIGGPELLAQTKPAEIGFIKNATNDTYISLVTFGRSPTPANPSCAPSYSGCVAPFASQDTLNLWAAQKANPSLKLFNPYGSVYDRNMVDPAHWDAVHSTDHYCWDGTQQCVNATDPLYGNYYLNPNSDATIENHLMNAGTVNPGNRNTLINTVNGYYSFGGTDYAAGLNAGIKELNTNGNPTHNQTIIIMGDGINMMAPIAPGSLESYWPSDWYPRSNLYDFDESDIGKAASIDAATRAKNKGITIYGINFPDSDNHGHNGITDTALFTSMVSPGGYYYAPDPTQLSSIFNQIEGQIQNTAGVNTTMTLNFQNVNIVYNNATNTVPGNQTFSYVYDPTASTTITDQSGHTSVINQTDEWIKNQSLTFNVGTITVGQTWSTTFRMKVLQPGNIDVFGNQSAITFNTGEFERPGRTYVGAGYNINNTGFTMPAIQISDLHVTQNTSITDFIPLQWNLTYPGNMTADERVYYSKGNSPYNWKLVNENPSIASGNWTHTYNLDVRSLPAGTYYIEVTANALDATEDTQILSAGVAVGMAQKAFIKLE